MTHLGLGQEEAREWLTRYAAGEAQELPTALEVEVREHVWPIAMPQEVCFEPLDAWPSPPRDYLLHRNVSRRQVERWGIGYALWGELSGRIVIPVRTTAGVLAGYTGRTFSSGQSKRYRNAMACDGAQPGVLHGEHFWGHDRTMIVVTEGTFDALAIERALPGVTLGAIWGSQFLPIHAAKLARFGLVVVATDPDSAGDGAFHAIAQALRRHTTVRRMVMAPGQDAATMPPQALYEAFQGAVHG
jgi:DNA primase